MAYNPPGSTRLSERHKRGERSAGQQRSARNPHAASDCRDNGNALSLANARSIPLAAFHHAHDVAPFEVKKLRLFLMFGGSIPHPQMEPRRTFWNLPAGAGPQTVFERSRPSIPIIVLENATVTLHLDYAMSIRKRIVDYRTLCDDAV